MSEKLLSIIVPSYNMEKYLPKCLGSLVVAPELMEKLEVLVVNDGSKDRTSEIAHEFEAKYPGVFRVIDKANGHYGSCINVALPLVKSKYVRVVDADDLVYTDSLTFYLNWLSDLDADVIITNFDRVDEFDNVLSQARYILPLNGFFSMDESLATNKDYIGNPAITYRTKMLIELGYKQWENSAYTDMQWAMFPMARAKKVVFNPVVLYKYLIGREGQSVSAVEMMKGLEQQAKVACSLYEYYYNVVKKEAIDCKEYYFHLVRSSAQWLLRLYIFGFSDTFHKTDGKWFDAKIKDLMPEVYESLNDVSISRFPRFKYIKAWRRNGYNRNSLGFKWFYLKGAIKRMIVRR